MFVLSSSDLAPFTGPRLVVDSPSESDVSIEAGFVVSQAS